MKTIFYMSSFLFICWLSTIEAQAQNVGINSTGGAPNASAMLDIDATDKGVLVPRIALVATNSVTPITSPAASLLVYNTASASSGTTAVNPGYYYWDGTKWVRLINSGTGLGTAWQLAGNAGTTAGTDFIGTTDNQDLVFKRNGTQSGLLNSNLGCTSFGVSALNPSNTGVWNTAFGVSALSQNTSGTGNSAIGGETLINNTTGKNNVALGYGAGNNNSTGTRNIFIGCGSDGSAGTYTNATAIGYNAKVGQSNAMVLGGIGTDGINVGVGTPTPDADAILDLTATNKAFLPPRIAIISFTDNVTVPTPTDGMLIYATATNTTIGLEPGVFYWGNNQWNRLQPQVRNSNDAAISGFYTITAQATPALPAGYASTPLTIGSFSFRLYFGSTGPGAYSNQVRTQIRYNGSSAAISVYYYAFAEYDVNGGITTYGTLNLTAGQWNDYGEFGVLYNSEEKRQYTITPVSATDLTAYRVEYLLSGSANSNIGTNAKSVIFAEYFKN